MTLWMNCSRPSRDQRCPFLSLFFRKKDLFFQISVSVTNFAGITSSQSLASQLCTVPPVFGAVSLGTTVWIPIFVHTAVGHKSAVHILSLPVRCIGSTFQKPDSSRRRRIRIIGLHCSWKFSSIWSFWGWWMWRVHVDGKLEVIFFIGPLFLSPLCQAQYVDRFLSTQFDYSSFTSGLNFSLKYIFTADLDFYWIVKDILNLTSWCSSGSL